MLTSVVRAGAVVGLLLAVCACESGNGPAVAPSDGAGTETRPSPRPSRSAAAAPRAPKGTLASFVVFDRGTGRTLLSHRPREVFRSASVVKILIALDHLERNGLRAADRPLLQVMLRSSDDRAATAFWKRGGQGEIVRRTARRLGLTETAPPPADKPGFWGYTALSAGDLVKTYRYLLDRAPRGHRDFVMGQLRRATRCGTDRFDQSFGIPRALPRPWAVKQGWSGFGLRPAEPCRAGAASGASFRNVDLGIGRPVLHTTGVVGRNDRRIVVVLTLHPAGTSFRTATARLTALTREVHRAAG
ncbi:hypothetical protein [Actinomadura kijaniata]|uniref:hypothetical protein n=1 Tax=Actinomadura kijaniata TaxID=46161 RepID=UPI000B0A1D46|nr:hypothetical protein [Actinomadura kijaniata]